MNEERMYQVLQSPLISEKSTNAGEYHNQVVFQVATDANKTEIKNAVAQLFGVTVTKVTTSQIKPKVKRFRGQPGKRKGWKKAYVTLAQGDDIDFLDGAIEQQG